jgi:septum formation protein
MLPELILASTSKYRKTLVEKLGLEFRALAPLVDEEALKRPDLSPRTLAEFLARAKAESLGAVHPEAVVIGGDQLVALGDEILNKPRDEEDAFHQLRRMSGRSFDLVTAIGLAHRGSWTPCTHLTRFHVRELSDLQILRYLARDKPFDCAGSFRFEDTGITLFRSVESTDPLVSMGIPLMALIELLEPYGYVIPGPASAKL